MNEGPRLDRDLMFEDVFKEMPAHLQASSASSCAQSWEAEPWRR